MAEPRRAGARRAFWPTVLLGAAGAGLAAYAGAHHWITLDPKQSFTPVQQTGLDSPATTALALVALAAWGVFLVTRGRVRRGLAVLAAIAALAPIPTIWTTRHDLLAGHAGSTGNGWPWVALVGCVVALAAAVVAVLKAPQWPEMGSRYDAPTDAVVAHRPVQEQSSLDLWKSLDEGQDPTADQD
jgi:hypothetical protein